MFAAVQNYALVAAVVAVAVVVSMPRMCMAGTPELAAVTLSPATAAALADAATTLQKPANAAQIYGMCAN